MRSDTADPLYSIANLTTMWLKANVPENEIALIRVGSLKCARENKNSTRLNGLKIGEGHRRDLQNARGRI